MTTYMVTGESLALQDDLVLSSGIWMIEGGHEKMQVCGQRLHNSDLRLIRAHNGCHLLSNMSIGIEPCR